MSEDLIFVFPILGKEWQLRILKKKKYNKKRGKDSVATTIAYKRRIDIHESGTDLETLIHELVHAYLHELCLGSCTKLSAEDIEEFFAELMAKYGRELLELAEAVYMEIHNRLAQISSPLPPPSNDLN